MRPVPRRTEVSPAAPEPLASRRALGEAGIVALAALAFRIAHVLSFAARGAPEFARPSLDAAFYDEWARRIAGGEWVGGTVFQGVPLYGYFLAAVYGALGAGPMGAAVVQSTFGAAGVAFLYLFCRSAFSRRMAIVAAALAVPYGPFLLFESLRLAESLAVFFAAAVLLATYATLRRPTPAAALGLGVLLGFAALARERYLLFAPILVAGAVVLARRGSLAPPKPVAALVLFLAGLAAPLSVSLAHNVAAAGDPVLLSSSGGVNFFIGNRRGASGSFDPPRELGLGRAELYARSRVLAEEAEGRSLAASEVSSYWTGRALRELREAPLSDVAGLFGRKLAYFFKGYEFPDVVDAGAAASGSFVLSLPLPSYRWLSPLAIVGFVLAFRLERRDPLALAVLFGLIAAHLGFLLLFFVSGRFRVSAVPFLIPFAAATIEFGIQRVRARRFGSVAIAAVAVALAAAFANADGADVAFAARQNAATTRGNRGQELLVAGKVEEAEAELREAIRLRPDYAKAKYFLALALRRQNRLEEALATVEDSIRDDPGYGRARTLRGQLLIDFKKRPDLAVPELEEALRLDPREAQAAFALAAAHQVLGRKDLAAENYRLAAELDPRLSEECRKRVEALK